MSKLLNRYCVWIVLCLTLGLAPFFPEPHVVEKLRWVARGAEGMRPIDWFDLVFHGAPWVVLAAIAVRDIVRKVGKSRGPTRRRGCDRSSSCDTVGTRNDGKL